MTSPSISTLPAVGSMSRLRQRTSVDFPDPESPMTTKTSPGDVELTSRTAATQPVRASARRAEDRRRASDEPSACGPNTFHTPATRVVGGAK